MSVSVSESVCEKKKERENGEEGITGATFLCLLKTLRL